MVEPPGGHPLRDAPPLARVRDREVSVSYLALTAGKHAIRLDRSTPAGQDIWRQLVASADAVVHDLPSGRAAAQNLDEASLRAIRPDLVVTAITPFGSWGPDSERSASDLTLAAAGGSLLVSGLPDRQPLLTYGHQPQLFGGILAAAATLAALVPQPRPALPGLIDVSLQEAVAGALDLVITSYTYSRQILGRYGNRLLFDTPLTDLYQTRDGFLMIEATMQAEWRALCELLGRSEWVVDRRFETWEGRKRHGDVLSAALSHWCRQRGSYEALAECQARRIPSCVCVSMAELLQDPQLAARGFFGRLVAEGLPPLRWVRLPFVRTARKDDEVRVPSSATPDPVTKGWAPKVSSSERAVGPPLAGVRVVDLTHAWAGPYAALQLAWLGAEVWKIEGSNRPDSARFFSVDAAAAGPLHERGGYYHEWNRNKSSVVLNLEHAEAVDLLKQLVARADVLVSNFSPRVLPKWGMGWEALEQLNPKLIHVTMPAFGSEGPYRDFVGYGETLEAAGGLMRLSGYPGLPPVRSGVAYPDPLAGAHAALAAIAGLAWRVTTGRGTWLDLSQQECVARMTADALIYYQLTHEEMQPTGNRRPDLLLNEVVPCRGEDEWVAVSIRTLEEMAALGRVAGMVGEPSSDLGAVAEALASWARPQAKFEVARHLIAMGIAAAPVMRVDELLSDPHLAARGFFERVDHPVVGAKPHPRAAFRLGRTHEPTRAAPVFDSDTNEVLARVLGTGPEELARLRSRGIVGGQPTTSPLAS